MVKVRKYKRRDGTKVVSHKRSSVEPDMKFKAGDEVKKKESKAQEIARTTDLKGVAKSSVKNVRGMNRVIKSVGKDYGLEVKKPLAFDSELVLVVGRKVLSIIQSSDSIGYYVDDYTVLADSRPVATRVKFVDLEATLGYYAQQLITENELAGKNPFGVYDPRDYDKLMSAVEDFKRTGSASDKAVAKEMSMALAKKRGEKNFRAELMNFLPVYDLTEKDMQAVMKPS